MRKITGRDIQVFVGGAFAFEGLNGLIALPYHLGHSGGDSGRPIASIVAALALPLGLGVFAGGSLGVRLIQIYLWVLLICCCVALLTTASILGLRAFDIPLIRSITLGLLINIILLTLLLWSRSRRFPHDHNA
jgi:hypothetical protein